MGYVITLDNPGMADRPINEDGLIFVEIPFASQFPRRVWAAVNEQDAVERIKRTIMPERCAPGELEALHTFDDYARWNWDERGLQTQKILKREDVGIVECAQYPLVAKAAIEFGWVVEIGIEETEEEKDTGIYLLDPAGEPVLPGFQVECREVKDLERIVDEAYEFIEAEMRMPGIYWLCLDSGFKVPFLLDEDRNLKQIDPSDHLFV